MPLTTILPDPEIICSQSYQWSAGQVRYGLSKDQVSSEEKHSPFLRSLRKTENKSMITVAYPTNNEKPINVSHFFRDN